MKRIYLTTLLLTSLCGSIFSQITFGWVVGVQGTDNVGETMSVTDHSKNVYTIGAFYGTIDLDPGPGVSSATAPTGKYISYIQKLDSSGNLVFAKLIGDVGTGLGAIGIDDSINLYLAGGFSDTVDFDPGLGVYNLISTPPDINMYLLKLDSAGNFIWVKNIDITGVKMMKVDPSGNCYWSGYSYGSGDFDPGPGTIYSSGGNQYIAKYNSNGNLLWVKGFGYTFDADSPYMDIDSWGNIYLSGRGDGPADYDPGPAVFTISPSGNDLYFLKLDASGNFVWARHLPVSATFFQCQGASCDAIGNLYLTGRYTGSVDFDPTSGITVLASTGTHMNYFLQKITHNGGFGWAKSFGNAAGDNYGTSILAKGNAVYTSGYFSGTTDFDPGPATYNLNVTTSYTHPGFIHKLDTTGNFIWAESFGQGNGSNIFPIYITIDDENGLYLNGVFTGSGALDFNPLAGSAVLTGTYKQSSYILKLKQSLCDMLVGVIDSVRNVNCANPGFASAHAYNGNPPYLYHWNTIPITADSVANFYNSGTYQLSVIDAEGCLFEREFMLLGPSSIPTFDLQANMVCNNFRPGFNSHIWLDAFNDACDTVSGSLSIVLDPLVNYSSAIPTPDNIAGDTLKWNFTALNYDFGHVLPLINVTTSTDAMIGDSVCFYVSITPTAGDADNANNFKHYCLPIVNGYDPNDKKGYPIGECRAHYIVDNELMTYTIRFQNTGSAEAINIHLLDTLDTDLDLSTVRVVGNSHPVITEILPGNVLNFRFDNIHLADSTSDEAHSHGYIVYEVNQFPALTSGTLLDNTAYIYFDLNTAVETNHVKNLVVDSIPNYHTSETIYLTCGDDYIFPDGNIITGITSNMNYVSNFSAITYCDSSITTNVSIIPLITTVTQIGTYLSANLGYTYQWIDCSTNLPIPGAIWESYHVTANGDYAVIITHGSCIDTSICVNMNFLGLSDMDSIVAEIYPNPATKNLTISTVKTIAEKISITDLSGRTVMNVKPASTVSNLDVSSLQNGIYLVKVQINGSTSTVKLLKE